LSATARHILVLGGRRSGKSRFAEELVVGSGLKPSIIATATAGDQEMRERIAAHRSRRSAAWSTVEEPFELAEALIREAQPGRAVLVDCLTLWLSNLMEAGRDIDREVGALTVALAQAKAPVVLVSNEVGAGIVPANALARRFSDWQGVLNVRVAASVGRVVQMTAGIPTVIKPAAGVSL
jgi:adenosylcobinamide kinase/adenosylcobinamide-phosphate guanylyltransferase